ncbi:hypothetical protein [Oceanobacillus indicireducens]|uniref:Uncharacterized protein n=1 Tax=Oceanobacillus indicireducens TaxID=1004261 RepID=A0A917Y2T9_9BACI|nr:hypothetical protein [Oceanobacillus indicireducens]GGN65572.1 hypothetical protein GCM10007971_34540 [Oceanobacillus indicireducens]
MSTGFVTEYILNKIKSGATDIAVNYISALPIMIGVSIGVYALLNMISKTLAKFGVVGVFVYGALIVIF